MEPRDINVFVACEFSGVVRDAFIKRGFNAVSCDILPTDRPGPHIQGDVRDNLYGWDLIIAHPPCTHLAVSGARYFKNKILEQQYALGFVTRLLNAPANFIALENPVGVISTKVRKPEQIIQPWMFGHPESKKTCLWLKNLPPLEPTNVLVKPASGVWANQTPSGQNKLGPSKDRWKLRSITYQGIADAMAEQWGDYVLNNKSAAGSKALGSP